MATKKRTTQTTRTYSVPSIVKALAYVSVMLMGLGIAIGVVFSWFPSLASAGNYIKSIATTIGLIVLCWYSYYYARSSGRTWFTLWVVAVVLIVVFQILGIVNIAHPFKF